MGSALMRRRDTRATCRPSIRYSPTARSGPSLPSSRVHGRRMSGSVRSARSLAAVPDADDFTKGRRWMMDGMMSGGMMWAMGLVWLLVVVVLLLAAAALIKYLRGKR